MAVSSGRRVLTAEARAAEFERLAQSSQLQALRYQINPHFLFNTLNSLSALVMTNRTDEAEAMILGLSNFFRSTLTTDPSTDLTLNPDGAYAIGLVLSLVHMVGSQPEPVKMMTKQSGPAYICEWNQIYEKQLPMPWCPLPPPKP